MLQRVLCATLLALLSVSNMVSPVAGSSGAGGAIVLNLTDAEGRQVEAMILEDWVPVRVSLVLSNMYPTPHEILITLFVDGVQREFSIDDKPGFVRLFRIGPSTSVEGELLIPELQHGFHSVVVLAILEPYQAVRGLAVLDTWGMHSIARRLEFTVGHTSAPSTAMPETPTTAVSPTYPDLHGALLSEGPEEPVGWLGGSWHLGDKRFYVHLGNQTGRTEEYLVTLLVDWRQVALDPANGVQRGYVVLEPGEIRSLAASVSLPSSFGRHSVVALAFNQPYSSLLAVPVVGVVEDTHRVYLRSLLPWLLLAGGVMSGVCAVAFLLIKHRRKEKPTWTSRVSH